MNEFSIFILLTSVILIFPHQVALLLDRTLSDWWWLRVGMFSCFTLVINRSMNKQCLGPTPPPPHTHIDDRQEQITAWQCLRLKGDNFCTLSIEKIT